jgi:hypothetical protein
MAAQHAATITRASSSVVNPAVDGCATKRGTGLALMVLARPWQWVKNGLVLAALVFSQRLFRPRDAVLAAVALVTFCALSSFAYVLNDISDREADRLNPEKRDRPLACRQHEGMKTSHGDTSAPIATPPPNARSTRRRQMRSR